MTLTGLPKKQGLYDPKNEHDACGIGFIANLKGKATHQMVQNGLTMLKRLEHRGAQGSDPDTGDGAGIMIQIPHDFFLKEFAVTVAKLPSKGKYGVGMLFLPNDFDRRAEIEKQLEAIIEAEGQTLLGWRTVPVDNSTIGKGAKASQPFIRQVFIGANEEGVGSVNVKSGFQMNFERKLYVIRKQFEKVVGQGVYVCSMSSQTIVYKGLLTPNQLSEFYLDFQDPEFTSVFSIVHSRFSTNTFPSWERAHPNRYLIHNGEINTLRGNVNWMLAREKRFQSEVFANDLQKVTPILDMDGSDSAILDNSFEFFYLAGRSLPEVAMMLIPEPWEQDDQMSDSKKAFYEYHSCLMEPWDGPTAISFSDGKQIGAILDRNGLRPARYYITNDDTIVFSSEVGVLDVSEETVVQKGRLSPGRMLLVDLEEGRIVSDTEIKEQVANENPYRKWLDQSLLPLDRLTIPQEIQTSQANDNWKLDAETIFQLQQAFGYTQEELTKNLAPMIAEGKDPIAAMGLDTPLAVLSNRPQLLYNYFKQSFAQVTNPPIDAIREECVTSTSTYLGAEGNLLQTDPNNCRRIRLETPILTDMEFTKLLHNPHPEFSSATIPMLFSIGDGEDVLEKVLDEVCRQADQAITAGHTLLILSDKGVSQEYAAIPALLAVSCLHHHLVRNGTRTNVSILVESGEPRDVHQFSMLIGYGADAIYPYLAFATVQQLIIDDTLQDITYEQAVTTYIHTATKGIVKVMSKMGISTIQSYRGAQIFEAVGIGQQVTDKYFTGTSSQIGGIELPTIAKEALLRHQMAYQVEDIKQKLDVGCELQWRKNGEYHAFNPPTVHMLQRAVRQEDYDAFKQYTEMANEEQLAFLRNSFDFKPDCKAISIDEVESVESICRRFKTGAMSYGALSKEAHETLAIAMNRLGGKSNSGEGGEDAERFVPDSNGDLRRSAIKQVASGRFGVTSHYLVNADELQIKMAQGAKPGEGGQLPGKKVYPWIAEVRGSTPGVGLISPPPHHDIYSIEDLAQLIFDLKNANPRARISVKLVSKAGVGTIAAGVAKGLADVIVISGHEGGTGAAPRTSIKHAGLPWELGLVETHQTLLLNQLRDRVVLETDGKLMTGRDVVMAAVLGAEEFGFATAPLISIGCVMARVCHLDTCPVGVATQNPELRAKFVGEPKHAVTFMRFIAQEVREIMAQLGFRTIEEMVGRTDVLMVSDRVKSHWKAKDLDLSALLYQPEVPAGVGRTHQRKQDHKLEETLDRREILAICQPALESKKEVVANLSIHNRDRVVGTILGSEISKRYGADGLPEDTIRLNFIGSAGQSFGAFIPKGVTLSLEGDANDYVGKGLSGGKLIVYPSAKSTLKANENSIIGNVAFYGATSGKAFVRGIAGERFCVRNSGLQAVVEGVGDHGCEYMTGGRVVVLGQVGKNFAAGMSGGTAYVLAEGMTKFAEQCNQEMVLLETLQDPSEIETVKQMIEQHVQYTQSEYAKELLERWDQTVQKFVRVIPKEYKRMLKSIHELEKSGISREEAILVSFEQSHKKQSVKKAIKNMRVDSVPVLN